METYKIRLPNGAIVERQMERTEAEYWISLGMYVGHGVSQLTTVFAAERLDDEDEEDDESLGEDSSEGTIQ